MSLRLVFTGTLKPGVTQADAAQALAAVFKKPPEQLEKMLFRGRPVQVKVVETAAQADRYVQAFDRAGLTLQVQPAGAATAQAAPPAPESTPPAPAPQAPVSSTPEAATDAPEPDKPPPRRRRGHLRLVSSIVVALVAGCAWYTAPLWRGADTSALQARLTNALATRQVLALGHLDVQRTNALQQRLFGAPDPQALLSSNDRFASLTAAGLSPAETVDDVLGAIYLDGEDTFNAAAITGDFDVDDAKRWLAQTVEVANRDDRTHTMEFAWVDTDTCEVAPLHAARFGDGFVLVTRADKLDGLWQRVTANRSAEIDLSTWSAAIQHQLLTLALMTPADIGQAADGITGMMLAKAGSAAQAADAVYVGMAPAALPPGIVLSGSVMSSDTTFVREASDAATGWLEELRATAGNSQELTDIYDRLQITSSNSSLAATVRLDTDLDEELRRLVQATIGQAFGAQPQLTDGPVEERLEEDPTRFVAVDGRELADYASFGKPFFAPQWQQGPFALSVASLTVDEDKRLQVNLKGEGRGLPNLGARSRLVRMRVTDAVDETGTTLLDARQCGPSRNTEWTDAGHVSRDSRFVDNELTYFPTVSLQKALALAPDVRPERVAAITGEVEYRLATGIERLVVQAPVAGKAIEAHGVRVHFDGAGKHTMSYRASGTTERLLAVRALNADGAVLANGGAMWGQSWLGAGEQASVDVQGSIHAIEVFVASALEPRVYPFALTGAFPSMAPASNPGSVRLSKPVATTAATPAQLTQAMTQRAPAVTFDYNAPQATATAGPALVAVGDVRSSPYMGLVTQFQVFVPHTLPLSGQLNGATVLVDQVRMADGATLPIAAQSPLQFEPDGGYWSNGEYVSDPKKPWLKSWVTVQAPDYEGATPEALSGRVVFRAASDHLTQTMLATPGASTANAIVEVSVLEWAEGRVVLEVARGAEKLLGVNALTNKGENVTTGMQLTARDDAHRVTVSVSDVPHRLQLNYSSNVKEFEQPFTAALSELARPLAQN